ncbi:MAG: DegV family protein [Lachnospiraceae bacterium]|nr:DegV family protein [Lachnospiraceae bacterium]
MERIAVVTDSNSGITQEQAKDYGIHVLPMPFFIDGKTYFEDIDLTQEQFYEKLEGQAEISTSMPSVASVTDLWDSLLQEHDAIVHIPMSSGLSSSCETAMMLAQDYDGRVQVVNNQRISVTQKQAALDAAEMVKRQKGAAEIKDYLERTKFDSSIYIMVDTLYYLKKGGRITPAAAALGTLLKLKPVLQIQGEKLDAFAKARTVKQAKNIMIEAIKNDFTKRFGDPSGENMHMAVAYTKDVQAAQEFKAQVQEAFQGHEIDFVDPLSLSVACHIGPGALAVTCTKKLSAE